MHFTESRTMPNALVVLTFHVIAKAKVGSAGSRPADGSASSTRTG
jgi:hypothetical protein